MKVTREQFDQLHKFMAHMAMCRACTHSDGTTPTIKGCSVGHMLAVKASHLTAQLMREGHIAPESQEGVK